METYEPAMRREARRLIAEHGDLVEVRCVSGPPDYRIELVFADGHEEIIIEHSGGIDITMMKFGYMGTGTRCFHAFLDEAGFKDVSLEQLAEMEGPQVLRKGEPLKGIDLLVELCTRDDILDPDSLLDPAVEDLGRHGERGARALANLLTELLQCRSDKIGYAIYAAQQGSPIPELLSVLESIASAPSSTSPPVGARFRPQIAGVGQIGWTDGTAETIRKAASDALEVVSEGGQREEPAVEEEPGAPGPAKTPEAEAELPLWAEVSRDPSLVDPLILERLQKSMCFMVRDETGPVAALIIRASLDEFRSPPAAETSMSLYAHHHKAPTFALYGLYPIVWDDPEQPFFKETWMVGASEVTGPPDPLRGGELSRLEALLSQEYTYFLIVDPSNQLVAARRVNHSPETRERFLGLLPKVRAARSVTISNVELISALQEYMNRVSLEEVRAGARRLMVAEAEPTVKERRPVIEDLERPIPSAKITPVPTRARPVRTIFAGIAALLGVLSLVGFYFTTGATIHDYVKGLVSARIPLQTQLAIVLGLLAAFLVFAGLSVFLTERRKIGILFWSGLVVIGLICTGYILAYVWEGGLLREVLPSAPPTATPVPTIVTFEDDLFSFEYPSNWEVITEEEIDVLLDISLKGLSPDDYDYIGGVYTGGVDGCLGCAHIAVVSLKDPNLTGTLTDEQYEQVKVGYESTMGPRLISIERTEVGGMPGVEVVNIGIGEETKLWGVIVIPPEPGIAHSLSCLSHEDSFDGFEEVFARAIETLHLAGPAPAMVTPSPEAITYTVQPGDTLGKIAAEFGVTVEAIVEANDIEDPSLINVGQVLVIPQPE